MSQENVELVRAAYAAWNAGDMDAMRELVDPDIIWRPPEGWPSRRSWRRRSSAGSISSETYDAYVTELVGDVIDTPTELS